MSGPSGPSTSNQVNECMPSKRVIFFALFIIALGLLSSHRTLKRRSPVFLDFQRLGFWKMLSSNGMGMMAVAAVSGSVVLIVLQMHRRMVLEFMKKVESELGM